jgi:hypothetical protein
MYANYLRGAVFVGQRDRDLHFALQGRIVTFAFVDLNDPLARQEFHEMAVVSVRLYGVFPTAAREL